VAGAGEYHQFGFEAVLVAQHYWRDASTGWHAGVVVE
jgi:hypothetical protein